MAEKKTTKPPVVSKKADLLADGGVPPPLKSAAPALPSAYAPRTGRGKDDRNEIDTLRAKAALREQDAAFQRTLQRIAENADDVAPKSILPFLLNWAKDLGLAGGAFDPENDAIDRAYAEAHVDGVVDSATARRDRDLSGLCVRPGSRGGNRNNPACVVDDGFKPRRFAMDPAQKAEARAKLSSDIQTVSAHYAAEAGLSAKDMARALGGVATIESSYGVLRSVQGTKYSSSAGGAFHYLDGTTAEKVRQNMNDPFIAARVRELGVDPKNISKRDAWTLKEDNILAASLVAKDIARVAAAHPEMRADIVALTTRYYQSHNMGEGGAKALERGGVSAVAAIDSRIIDNNPMFFRGAQSGAEVTARYQSHVASAMRAADDLVAKLDTKQPPVQLALKKPDMAPAPAPG